MFRLENIGESVSNYANHDQDEIEDLYLFNRKSKLFDDFTEIWNCTYSKIDLNLCPLYYAFLDHLFHNITTTLSYYKFITFTTFISSLLSI